MSARLAALLALPLAGACAPHATATAQPPADTDGWAATCEDWDEWNKPGPPFRIYGNSWYVGTCGISAILVTGDEGHVLIDGATEAGAELVAANIRALGFDLSDVKLLLHSHEHFDHVAGLAELQRRTAARLLASPPAAPVIASGVADESDPQASVLDPFPAATVDGVLTMGQPVRQGALSLTPIATPGHTQGALSWQWRSCEGGDCRTIVYADSLSPVSAEDYRFSDHPEVVAGLRAGLARLAALDCDIVLTPHPSASDMRARIAAGSLVDDRGCANYASSIEARWDERLASEGAAP